MDDSCLLVLRHIHGLILSRLEMPKLVDNRDQLIDKRGNWAEKPSNPIAQKHPKEKKLEIPPKPVKKGYRVALYDFRGQARGDLFFKKGDKIEVLRATHNIDDWWMGRSVGSLASFLQTTLKNTSQAKIYVQ